MKPLWKEMLEDWKEYLVLVAGATMLTVVVIIIAMVLTAALFSVSSWVGKSIDASGCGIVNQGQTL